MRHVSVTGGEKEVKAERYDLLPWDVIEEDARLYGRGAEKYAGRNWEHGYPISLSMAALMRHLIAFWQRREDVDPETGCHHLSAVRFHAAVMMRFAGDPRFDDRP